MAMPSPMPMPMLGLVDGGISAALSLGLVLVDVVFDLVCAL